MAELLAGGGIIATQDGYADVLTLGPAAGVASVRFSVLGSQPLIVQFWRYLDSETRLVPILDPWERTIPGQSIGLVATLVGGARFRSAVAGSPSSLRATLYFDGDEVFDEGKIAGAAISAAGKVG